MILCDKMIISHQNDVIMAKKIDDMLIIPDVHGRGFWKDAVDDFPNLPVIFLGDYMDPYPQEGIDNTMALENFQRIMDYKRQNAERVILLIGNHDLHYMSSLFTKLAMGTRFSQLMFSVLKKMFNDDERFFHLACTVEYEGKKVLFTHAGVSKIWYEVNQEVLKGDIPGCFNDLMNTDEGIEALANIGSCRGGFHEAGSILWADVSEVRNAVALPQYYQIFGHTQQREGPIITKQFACLDCRRAFLLSEVMNS